MEQTNGMTQKKQVLFSIGSYSEKDRRVINKIAKNGLFSRAESVRAAIHRPASPRVGVDTVDFPKYNTLPRTLRLEPSQNGQQAVEKPTCPPASRDDQCIPVRLNGSGPDKPAHPPRLENRSISLEPEQLRNTGKVALTIAAYEGEPRTPTRLEFLPQTRLSRSSSKASSSGGGDSVEPIGSRLQNELVATLKRSNLRKRSDRDALQENGEANSSDDDKQASSEEAKEDGEITNGSVKLLATELDKKITFKINPENDEQTCEKKE